MAKEKSLSKTLPISVVAAAICAFSSIALLAQQFNYSLYLPSIYRVIYVPLYFWICYAAYLSITHHVFLKNEIEFSGYARHGLMTGLFLNLYILLGNLVFTLLRDQAPLSDIYFGYIKAVFLLATTSAILASGKKLSFGSGRNVSGNFLYMQFFIVAAYFVFLGLMTGHPRHAALIALSIAAGFALRGIDPGAVGRNFGKIFTNPRSAAITIFLIAFALRLAFGLILVHKTTQGPHGYDGYLYASDDGLTYDAVANKIVKDPSIMAKGEVALWGNWDRFYSVFLAAVYSTCGRNFYIVVLIQSVLGALIPLSVFFMARLLFSETVGMIASLAVAFKGGLIALSSYMGHEAIWLPLLYLFILMLTRYYVKPVRSGVSADILMGIVLGAISLFRSLYFYFLPFLCLWETLFFRHIKITRRLLHLFILTLFSACIVIGTAHIFSNKMELLNRGKANMLWSGSRQVSPPFHNIGNERLEASGINFFMDFRGSLRIISADPIKYMGLAAAIYPLRVIAYFESYQFGFFDPIYMLNPAKVANEFASTLEFYFTVFFMIGLGVCFVTRGVVRSPVFMLLVFHILFFAVLLFQPAPRLKETSSPLVYLIGSAGAVRTFQFFNRRVTNKDGAI